jgi:hypothetical protein
MQLTIRKFGNENHYCYVLSTILGARPLSSGESLDTTDVAMAIILPARAPFWCRDAPPGSPVSIRTISNPKGNILGEKK